MRSKKELLTGDRDHSRSISTDRQLIYTNKKTLLIMSNQGFLSLSKYSKLADQYLQQDRQSILDRTKREGYSRTREIIAVIENTIQDYIPELDCLDIIAFYSFNCDFVSGSTEFQSLTQSCLALSLIDLSSLDARFDGFRGYLEGKNLGLAFSPVTNNSNILTYSFVIIEGETVLFQSPQKPIGSIALDKSLRDRTVTKQIGRLYRELYPFLSRNCPTNN